MENAEEFENARQLLSHRLRWRACTELLAKPLLLSELARRLGVTPQRLQHHLNVLERVGVLRSDALYTEGTQRRRAVIHRYALDKKRFVEFLDVLIRELEGVRNEAAAEAGEPD